MTAGPDDAELPPAPPRAAAPVFGDRLELAGRYARLLAGEGVVRGLIGPREASRLWDRHLLNCALLTDLLPHGARVVDVGSGAGLPGIVLSVRRPDLRVDLVEPMQRRTTFLEYAVRKLGLGANVRVVRGRADASQVRAAVAPAGWVTARAVAPLARLTAWCLPLLAAEGRLLAMKGAGVDGEVAELHAAGLAVRSVNVVKLEASGVDPVRVAVVTASGSRQREGASRR